MNKEYELYKKLKLVVKEMNNVMGVDLLNLNCCDVEILEETEENKNTLASYFNLDNESFYGRFVIKVKERCLERNDLREILAHEMIHHLSTIYRLGDGKLIMGVNDDSSPFFLTLIRWFREHGFPKIKTNFSENGYCLFCKHLNDNLANISFKEISKRLSEEISNIVDIYRKINRKLYLERNYIFIINYKYTDYSISYDTENRIIIYNADITDTSKDVDELVKTCLDEFLVNRKEYALFDSKYEKCEMVIEYI